MFEFSMSVLLPTLLCYFEGISFLETEKTLPSNVVFHGVVTFLGDEGFVT